MFRQCMPMKIWQPQILMAFYLLNVSSLGIVE
jgi:hypothetical protein